MKLKELDGFVIEASPNTYLLTIKAKGKTNCPVDISLIKNGKKFGSPYKLDGEIDTFFRRDWYQSEISFKVGSISCASNIDVTVKLHQ